MKKLNTKKINVLTERELLKKLYKLRRCLAKGGFEANGLVFLSVKALLRHAERFCDVKALARLVREVAPYVPVRVSDDSLYGLMEAAAGGYEAARRYERRLTSRSLLDFLLICGGGGEREWREAVSLSILIRNYKSAGI